jgi:hypothetical protein
VGWVPPVFFSSCKSFPMLYACMCVCVCVYVCLCVCMCVLSVHTCQNGILCPGVPSPCSPSLPPSLSHPPSLSPFSASPPRTHLRRLANVSFLCQAPALYRMCSLQNVFSIMCLFYVGATSRILFPVEGGRVKGEGRERGGGGQRDGGQKKKRGYHVNKTGLSSKKKIIF